MRVNESRITNLLSIPQLEKHGFRVTTDTLTELVVYTPQGEKIVFLQDTGLCNMMSYIDVRQFKNDFALANIKTHQEKSLQTVCKNYDGFTRRRVNRAILACKA